jgi:flagellar biosynthesis protein FlhA
LGIILAMIVPLPPILVDLLIAINITLSVLVLLVGIYISRPVDFSVFPTTLLLMTLFRLALNISSSRLILLTGNTGTSAAGHIIEAFGSFVVGGNYVIGSVIFLVLIAIQYIVINHGAVRISEVTARFALDALPGKQMSIDSDLNAGLIDESEARARRRQLTAEAEFYGAMDGASRFTQRDAVASILITVINIVAGFLVGVFQHGMDLSRALETYTVLTIGDGLVTVIPALMVSVSGGLIVTRASAETRLGGEFQRQMLENPQPLQLAAGVLLVMALIPGLPGVAFSLMSAATGAYAELLRRRKAKVIADTPLASPSAERAPSDLPAPVDPIAVEVGLGLVHLVEGGADSPLLRRITAIRKQISMELGYVLPPVRVTDNLSLKASEYAISIKGCLVERYELRLGCSLAIHPGTGTPPALPDSQPTQEPAFRIAAWWVPSIKAEVARAAGFTVVDPVSALGTHLSETVKRFAHELFSRKELRKMFDQFNEETNRLAEEVVPKLLPMSTVLRVMQNLLRERVSIRDTTSILEALSESAPMTKNPILLTEYVRQALRRNLVQSYVQPDGTLAAYSLDPAIEQMIEAAVEHGEYSSQLNLPPQRMREVTQRIERALGATHQTALVITSSGARYFFQQLAEGTVRGLRVLAHGELPPGTNVVLLGQI